MQKTDDILISKQYEYIYWDGSKNGFSLSFTLLHEPQKKLKIQPKNTHITLVVFSF